MNTKRHWLFRFLAFAFFGFTLINLMYLNYVVFINQKNAGELRVASTTSEDISTLCDTKNCVPDLYNAIYQATSSLQLNRNTTSQSGAQTPQEFYIALGGGTNASSDWTNVGGASAYIDSTKYTNIQTVTFEASVSVPTGNQTVYVRLFNQTDQHPVWFSDVSLSGGQSLLLISSPITLDQGEKLYQVQMKTQLQYAANLTQSRVHIITF